MSVKNKLPRNWAVKGTGSREEMKPVLEYLREDYGATFSGGSLGYYGVLDGRRHYSNTPHEKCQLLSMDEFKVLSKSNDGPNAKGSYWVCTYTNKRLYSKGDVLEKYDDSLDSIPRFINLNTGSEHAHVTDTRRRPATESEIALIKGGATRIEDKPEPKFKIGDMVRETEGGYFCCGPDPYVLGENYRTGRDTRKREVETVYWSGKDRMYWYGFSGLTNYRSESGLELVPVEADEGYVLAAARSINEVLNVLPPFLKEEAHGIDPYKHNKYPPLKEEAHGIAPRVKNKKRRASVSVVPKSIK